VINRIEQLPGALERAQRCGLPAVLDCRVTFEPHPSFGAFGRSSSIGMSPRA
jgi:acetolactate synthase-1/2/3 large subunit